jgi:hypothetical protein
VVAVGASGQQPQVGVGDLGSSIGQVVLDGVEDQVPEAGVLATDGADVGVVGRADGNRASRAVLVVVVAARSARWRRVVGVRGSAECDCQPARAGTSRP